MATRSLGDHELIHSLLHVVTDRVTGHTKLFKAYNKWHNTHSIYSEICIVFSKAYTFIIDNKATIHDGVMFMTCDVSMQLSHK